MAIGLQTVVKIGGVLEKAAPALKEGIVYSTSTAASRPTMFDAFCKTMSQSHVAKKAAKPLVNRASLVAPQIKAAAQNILAKSGVDATVSCRVKGVTSTANKIQKKYKSFKSYDASREQIHDIILNDGTKNLIGDSFGIRYTLNSPSSNGIYEGILQQRGRNFQISCFEDYYGVGVTPYASPQTMDKFAKLKYVTPNGVKAETVAVSTPKEFGYTRTNINGNIFGVNTEIQVGGKLTNAWGDVEHLLYDMRQGKTLNFSHYTDAQVQLAKQIESAYKKVLANPVLNKTYKDDYLSKIWGVLRDAELNMTKPQFPTLPAGIPEFLSAENILKLAHK